MFSIKELEENLEKLTGEDYLQAEKDTLASSNNFIGVMQLNTRFQLNVAAMAFKANPHDLTKLPLKKFSRILSVTSNFLLSHLDDDEAQDD